MIFLVASRSGFLGALFSASGFAASPFPVDMILAFSRLHFMNPCGVDAMTLGGELRVGGEVVGVDGGGKSIVYSTFPFCFLGWFSPNIEVNVLL